MKNGFKVALAVCAIEIVCVCSTGLAHQDAKSRESQGSESSAKTASQADTASVDLQAAIKALADQVAALGVEIRKLRHSTEKTSLSLELLLGEERLARIEDKIESTQDSRAALDARERQQQYRLDNIQQEVTFRGGLDREAGEEAIRADVQRQLEDIHSQQAAAQKRVTDLQSQARSLRSRIEELRRKVDGPEKDQ
jgi:chromosome segregation ATPase